MYKEVQIVQESMGNYKGYYSYRPNKPCDRIKEFSSSWFKNKICLDIGCNSGEITSAIARKFLPKSIIGIDIDNNLIESAKKKLRNLCLHGKASTTFLVPRSVAVNKSESRVSFPYNISFEFGDVMSNESFETESSNFSSIKYDTILCLSVTKWIHLNFGDEGLLNFFQKFWELANQDGIVILEYQSWKSYLKNKSASQLIKDNFSNIKIRPEDFENILTNIGFVIVNRLGVPLSESKGFDRPILILQKKNVISESLQKNIEEIHCSAKKRKEIEFETELNDKHKKKKKKKQNKEKKEKSDLYDNNM